DAIHIHGKHIPHVHDVVSVGREHAGKNASRKSFWLCSIGVRDKGDQGIRIALPGFDQHPRTLRPEADCLNPVDVRPKVIEMHGLEGSTVNGHSMNAQMVPIWSKGKVYKLSVRTELRIHSAVIVSQSTLHTRCQVEDEVADLFAFGSARTNQQR